jgi:hypothetical protein
MAMPSGGPALAYDYENRAKSATMGSFVERTDDALDFAEFTPGKVGSI